MLLINRIALRNPKLHTILAFLSAIGLMRFNIFSCIVYKIITVALYTKSLLVSADKMLETFAVQKHLTFLQQKKKKY